jgi:hypothetical protein
MSPKATEDLCVLRDGQSNSFSVMLCRAGRPGQCLAAFNDRSLAADFAIRQRDRWLSRGLPEPVIHFPDNCPCTAAAAST